MFYTILVKFRNISWNIFKQDSANKGNNRATIGWNQGSHQGLPALDSVILRVKIFGKYIFL